MSELGTYQEHHLSALDHLQHAAHLAEEDPVQTGTDRGPVFNCYSVLHSLDDKLHVECQRECSVLH